MASWQCAQCPKRATLRCSRCRALCLCSRECLMRAWPSHKRECDVIKTGRDVVHNAGREVTETAIGQSIPLEVSVDEYTALFALGESVRKHYASTEQRLRANDPTLATAEKLRFYCDVLEAYDATSSSHERQSLVHKMVLNRRYNDVYRDAMARLAPSELVALNSELQRRRIGAWVKLKDDDQL